MIKKEIIKKTKQKSNPRFQIEIEGTVQLYSVKINQFWVFWVDSSKFSIKDERLHLLL